MLVLHCSGLNYH
jgi:hypothetical protein